MRSSLIKTILEFNASIYVFPIYLLIILPCTEMYIAVNFSKCVKPIVQYGSLDKRYNVAVFRANT